MNEEECNRRLRIYAGQLADRFGLKLDTSKIKDSDLLDLVIVLRSKWKGIDLP